MGHLVQITRDVLKWMKHFIRLDGTHWYFFKIQTPAFILPNIRLTAWITYWISEIPTLVFNLQNLKKSSSHRQLSPDVWAEIGKSELFPRGAKPKNMDFFLSQIRGKWVISRLKLTIFLVKKGALLPQQLTSNAFPSNFPSTNIHPYFHQKRSHSRLEVRNNNERFH